MKSFYVWLFVFFATMFFFSGLAPAQISPGSKGHRHGKLATKKSFLTAQQQQGCGGWYIKESNR